MINSSYCKIYSVLIATLQVLKKVVKKTSDITTMFVLVSVKVLLLLDIHYFDKYNLFQFSVLCYVKMLLCI